MSVCVPFKYADKVAPVGYVCQGCGAFGVRLYRKWNTFLSHQRLTCRACTFKEVPDDGFDKYIREQEHQIRGKCSAVPTEEGDTYWGYSSVPDAGVTWWNELPKVTAEEKRDANV